MAQTNKQQTTDTYASFGRRLGAYLLDGMILSFTVSALAATGLFSLFGLEIDLSKLSDPAYSIMENKGYLLVTFIIGLLYYTILQSSKWQATVGKKIVGIKVVTLEGERISYFTALVRHLVMFFLSSLFYIGFIMALFTKKKQALHDKLAKTLVVKENK